MCKMLMEGTLVIDLLDQGSLKPLQQQCVNYLGFFNEENKILV